MGSGEPEHASGLEHLKMVAAKQAASQVEDLMVVGLGSGSTASLAVALLGERVAKGLRIIGVPTSERTAELARRLGIPLATLADHARIDLTIDGADEVARHSLDLIKGRGGALLREKIVASASARLVIVVDKTKLSDRLGLHYAVPVEVIPFGWQATARRLRQLGVDPAPRLNSDGKEFVTDGGHYILDCPFGPIENLAELARHLDETVGVVEHGLFLGMTSQVIVGGSGRVLALTPSAR